MASFSNQGFATDDYLLLWDNIFNAEDYSKEPFVGSVCDYFCAQSYGQLRLHFDLVPLTVGPRVRYHSTDEDDENSQYLIYDIADMQAIKAMISSPNAEKAGINQPIGGETLS